MPNESSSPFFPILICLQTDDSSERFIHVEKPEDLPMNQAFVVVAHHVCLQCEEMARLAYGMGASHGQAQKLER